ncbi:calpain-D-like [Artemia franciscana]|uniref:Calpain catalytic domain-containing protein n=1 Tax=Artemia franciscana TaxID=6661 RepID=A0AA88KUW7_ARTSF|nr:hypothetical protein QYM36_018154 [Artemia franciscana]KAK2703365.1 hypothetical protein QYM36_018154 [Artemia franciscana]
MMTIECSACTFQNEDTYLYCEICLTKLDMKNQGLYYPADEALNKYKTILEECKKQKKKFTDESFPTKFAIYGSWCAENGIDSVNSYGIKRWFRPSDYPQGGWSVFDSPKSSDIIQGSLGDCWLISGLAVIAEREELLRAMIIPNTASEYGLYVIFLCIEGLRVGVVIDDYLPQTKSFDFAFSYAKRRQLWVSLIEKGVAKAFGRYSALIAGHCFEGLSILTGALCETYVINSFDGIIDKDTLWAKLISGHIQNFLMGASCGTGNATLEPSSFKLSGLDKNHAYSVLDVREIENKKLIKFKNPWGRSKWNGNWSPESSLWTEKVKQKLKYKEEKGVFWMEFQDILKFFDAIDVCRYCPAWHEERFKADFGRCSQNMCNTILTLNVFEVTQTEVVLYQSGLRGDSQSSRLDIMICIYRADASGTLRSLIESSPRVLRSSVGCYCVLEPGQYYIIGFSFNHWDSDNRPCIISVRSSKKSFCEKLINHPQFILADALIQFALKKGSKNKSRDLFNIYYVKSEFAGLLIVAENMNSSYWFQVKSDCSDSTNLVCTRNSLITCDSVPPLHRQVLNLLSHLEDTEGFCVANNLLHRVCKVASLKDWGPGEHNPLLSASEKMLHIPRPL